MRSNHLVVAEFVENSLVITRNNFLDKNSNLAEAGRWLVCRRQNSRYNVRRMPVKVHKAYQALCMTTVGKNRYLTSRKSKESLHGPWTVRGVVRGTYPGTVPTTYGHCRYQPLSYRTILIPSPIYHVLTPVPYPWLLSRLPMSFTRSRFSREILICPIFLYQ